MALAEDLHIPNSGQGDWLSCADSAMRVVTASLTEAPFGPAIDALNRYRDELNAVEALLIAHRKSAGHSDRATEGIITNSGGVSKGEAKKRTKRAAAVSKNPKLAKSLTSGALSTEQVDLVADASAKTGGDAAIDDKLIADIGAANPDQGRAIARKYVEEHESQGDRDTRHAWQRARRKVYRGQSKNGLSQLIIEGDDHSIGSMIRSLRRRADGLYRSDGGRDVPGHKHERTHDQRMFDAAFSQITGTVDEPAPSEPSQPAKPSPPPASSERPSSSAASDASPPASRCCPASDESQSISKQPTNRPGERPTMVFTAKLSEISDDPEMLAKWTAELVGQGVVPSAVASYFRCISDHSAMLLAEDGAVLRKGRAVRRVTPEQWVALVVRDGGCVLCQADHVSCEAHHLIPWEAPRKGETNIESMALLCVDCHHRVHENLQTLFWDPRHRRWRLRAAKPYEIPPSGHKRAPKSAASSGSNSPRPPNTSAKPRPAPDPHARETASGVLRHDLFDWIR